MTEQQKPLTEWQKAIDGVTDGWHEVLASNPEMERRWIETLPHEGVLNVRRQERRKREAIREAKEL